MLTPVPFDGIHDRMRVVAGCGLWARVGFTLAGALLASGCGKQADGTETKVHAVTSQLTGSCERAAYGGREYWFCRDSADWQSARETCSKAHLHLVTIDDASEDLFVARHVEGKSWIGAHSEAGTWRWSDGQAFWSGGRGGQQLSGEFTNWGSHQPNNDEHHTCAGISPHDARWHAWECNAHASFVCESEPISVPPDAPEPSCARHTSAGGSYWVCSSQKTFLDARASCQSAGMDLATIDASSENSFLAGAVAVPSFVGLTDTKREGAWKWTGSGRLTYCANTSTPSTSDTYTQWGQGQPGSSDCQYLTHGTRGYWLCRNAAPWEDARTACLDAGMTLAQVGDADENDFLSKAGARDAWLGGTDAAVEQQWRWADDNRLFWSAGPVPDAFASFEKKQPAIDTQTNCLSLANKGEWTSSRCDAPKAWVCEGAATADPELPDVRDCAQIADGGGQWSAVSCEAKRGYVCEVAAQNAYKSLDDLSLSVRDEYRTGGPRVSDVAIRPDSNVTEPFLDYGERFGLRECVDALKPRGTPRDLPHKGYQVIEFGQVYRGIPVYGRGYNVQRDPTTLRVSSITGRIERDLSLNVEPQLTVREAIDKAFDALRVPNADRKHLGTQPQVELVIYPTSQGRSPSWDLAYTVALPALAGNSASQAVISARSGQVIAVVPSIKQACSSPADISELAATAVEVSTYQQNLWLDPTHTAASIASGDPQPYLLASRGLSSDDNNPLFNRPLMYTRCPDQDPTRVASLASSSIVVAEASPENEKGAAFFMALQRCVEFMATDLTYKTITGRKPWIGFDAEGVQEIPLRLFREGPKPIGPHYDPGDQSIYYTGDVIPGWNFFGASTEVACHELAHGIWDNFALQYNPFEDLETAAVNEGFADVFGNAAEMSLRGYPGPGAWCASGDDNDNSICERDFAAPEFSTGFNCRVVDDNGNAVIGQCPRDYYGPDYCTFQQACDKDHLTSCCTPHRNSTVMSHWSYLVANGGEGVNQSSCAYELPAADPDLRQSIAKTLDVALEAIHGSHFGQSTGYEGFADATITSARNLFGTGSAEHLAVSRAWYAVNVKENFFEDEIAELSPGRGTGLVNPWQWFQWPLEPGVFEYDVQISDGPFEQPSVLFEKTVTALILEGGDFDGEKLGFLRVSLPYDSDKRFFWRVRPHSSEPWTDCFPIHSFQGTRKPDPIVSIKVDEEKDEKGKFRPGELDLEWTGVENSIGYELTLATRDLGCQRTGEEGEISADVTPDTSPAKRFKIFGVQPETHYFLNVRAIGPDDLAGQSVFGECKKLEFDTGVMRAPELKSPFDGDRSYTYHRGQPIHPAGPGGGPSSPTDPKWSWAGLDGPSRYKLTFYEIGLSGLCENQPAEVAEGDYETHGGPCRGCSVTRDDLFFPKPNPTGYCWNVISIAKNGKVSPPSETRRFLYTHHNLEKIAPGLENLLLIVNGDVIIPKYPAPLPGDSYGQDVTFSWTGDSDAARYRLKVGRYPWPNAGEPLASRDPANCLNQSCSYEPRDVVYGNSADELLQETTLTLRDGKASHGRYCWSVWPLISDPSDLSQPGALQPLVQVEPIYCYTSGPAKPAIDVPGFAGAQMTCDDFEQNPPVATRFDADLIKGTIKLDYVPDRQYRIHVSPHAEEDGLTLKGECEDVGPYYRDIYGCELTFSLKPKPDRTYWVAVRTFNSDVWPAQVGVENQVHCEAAGMITPPCGHLEEQCCDRAEADGGGVYCREGTCDPATGTCRRCGREVGSPCCPDGGEGTWCWDRLACGGSHCEHCGRKGELCCRSFEGPDSHQSACDDGLKCEENGICGNSCPSALSAPTLPPAMTLYQEFCVNDGGSRKFDDDLSLPTCKISGGTLRELVDEHVIPCTSSLGFVWFAAEGAKNYIVYYAEQGSSTVHVAGTNSTAFGTSEIGVTDEPRLFTIAVRGFCDKAGPAAVGMLAVSSQCN